MARSLSRAAALAVAILCFSPAASQAGSVTPLPQEVSPPNPAIHYLGRWDMRDPGAPRATWTCSGVEIAFKGTAINARLKRVGSYPDSYYQIAIDGQPTTVIMPVFSQDLYEIATGLPDSEHVVEIIRRNEAAWSAPFIFEGFQLEKDAKLLPAPHSDKRILIIGDSISCGCGNEARLEEGNPLNKENGYMTYGAIAARKFGAEIQVIAWSGRKLFPDNSMVELYDRTLAQDPDLKTDLTAWVPDIVVINLGTNEFKNSKHPPSKNNWAKGCEAFIATIRQTAPGACIFVASGPMGTTVDWKAAARKVVADLNKAGDKNVAYLPFPTQDIETDGVGGYWHPNITTHKKMADQLSAEIARVTGWKSVATAGNRGSAATQ